MHCNERKNEVWQRSKINRVIMNGIFTTFFLSTLTVLPLTVCLSPHLLDPAVDDFVLMHCVFMPNSQLCPLLMAQYPFCLYSLCFYIHYVRLLLISTYECYVANLT